MELLSCKVTPPDGIPMMNALSWNQQVTGPTQLELNKKEFYMCKRQATVTIEEFGREINLADYTFEEALAKAKEILEAKSSTQQTLDSSKFEKKAPTTPIADKKDISQTAADTPVFEKKDVPFLEEEKKEQPKQNTYNGKNKNYQKGKHINKNAMQVQRTSPQSKTVQDGSNSVED